MCSKTDHLKHVIDNNPCNRTPDLILLCETWLNKQTPSISVPGYNLIRKDQTKKVGGGVAILIKQGIKYKERRDLSDSTELECILIELENNKQRTIVGSLYRPPNLPPAEFITKYDNLIGIVGQEKKELVLGLDHNLDLLKCNTHKQTENFLETNLEHGLIPTIIRSTRITNTTATLIDNIMVSKKFCGITKSSVLIENASDHLVCLARIENFKTKSTDKICITSRDTRDINMKRLLEELQNINWTEELASKNVDILSEKFHHILSEKIEHFTPLVDRTIDAKKLRHEKWVTAGLLISLKRSKKLYKQTISKKTSEKVCRKYKEYNMILQKVKRHAKRSYYIEKCIEFRSDTCKLWKTMNEIIGKTNDKGTVIGSLKSENMTLTKSKDIVNKLGKHFSKIGKNYADKIATPDKNINLYLELIRRNKQSAYMTPTYETEISRLIDKLPNKRSSGHDNIDNIMLKRLKVAIVKPLVKIFNASIETGIFPTNMKTAEVVPLHKSGSREDKNNYRPISLLLTISKLLEKIVYKQVYAFLDSTNQLYNSQYGFRADHSCSQAISELVGEVAKNTEKNHTTCSIFIDLSKAFNTLEHTTVIKKLE